MWQQWVNLVLGLWIILSAFAGFTASGTVTNLTVTGLLITAFALWGALRHQTKDSLFGEGLHA